MLSESLPKPDSRLGSEVPGNIFLKKSLLSRLIQQNTKLQILYVITFQQKVKKN